MECVTKVEYGRVAMIRMPCPVCGDTSLVVDGKMAGCGHSAANPGSYKKKTKESEGRKDRVRLKEKEKRALVEAQGGRCFYCGKPFGIPVWHPRRKKVIYANLVFDHFLCWDFSRDSSVKNMVASCSVCNGIKGSKIFANADDARVYIKRRIERKGYEYDFSGKSPENQPQD